MGEERAQQVGGVGGGLMGGTRGGLMGGGGVLWVGAGGGTGVEGVL